MQHVHGTCINTGTRDLDMFQFAVDLHQFISINLYSRILTLNLRIINVELVCIILLICIEGFFFFEKRLNQHHSFAIFPGYSMAGTLKVKIKKIHSVV